MSLAIQVNNLSKAYRLGQIGTGTLSRDIERWFAQIRGKEDPFLKIGQTNDQAVKGTSEMVWSLKDIHIEVEQGDTLGIIGRNGAGKSTLLKILSRVTSPTRGNIKIKGRIASLLEVGTGFHPELTGRENIFLNGAILGMRKKEISKKLDQIVEFSGVARYLDTPVKRFSSGMYVRLAFAVAAHLESEILIVDEVLAVGDAEFQAKCLGRMNQVSKNEGRTILFVSHNMSAVKSLCKKGMVLKNGLLYSSGTASQAVTSYLTSSEGNGENVKLWEAPDAPGNNRIRLLSIQVKAPEDEIIDISTGIEIEVVCINFLLQSTVDFTFELLSDDECVLIHHGQDLDGSKDLKQGKYIVTIKIPPFILNQGRYSINAWFGLEKREVLLRVDRVLTFEINEAPVDHILRALPGLLRPRIDYKINFKPIHESKIDSVA